VRKFFWFLVKKLLFCFDAETAHGLSVGFMKILGRVPFLLRLFTRPALNFEFLKEKALNVPLTKTLEFVHPVGLAAGFDKNAELMALAENLGFAFVEVGTVTPRAQAGNDKPRLFRDPAREALFNRMGFNNEGADRVAKRLLHYRKQHPHSHLRVGVNLGKNKDTPAEFAPQDYALLAQRFASLADYLVINVSSPNTPGLRDLQELRKLEPIVKSMMAEVQAQSSYACPVFLKLAPEVEGESLKDTLAAAESWGVYGFVLTNTLGGEFKGQKGGWSGGPLRERALKNLEYARCATQRPLISVGGILTEEDAQLRLRAGATLVQVYTGWIYRGPTFPGDIVRSLTK
jgi:dihydroorotate dehydrogenase